MPPRGQGNVRVYIDGDPSGLGRATKQAETYVGSLGSRITTAGDKMASAGGKLTRAVTLPVLGVGIAAGKVAVDFDKSMRNVNSIAQLPEPQLERLEGKVLDLGGKTAQAPRTLAEGLYDLVSSGFDADESMGILGKSARAATAGLTTTEVSTAAVAAELNAYHLPARKAGEISDQLFETVNRGVITFEELATNIGDVLPFASSLDIGMEQVGASISTMTKEGIQAPETMTRVKNVMVAMLKPGKDLSKAIKETGAESGEALVKQKGFQGGLEALVGTTDGTKQAISTLFPNIRALGGVLALTGKNSKTAREDLAAFGDTSGATSKALKEQSKSVAYEVNELKAELEATAIEAAPPFLEAGKEIIGTLGGMAGAFKDLSPSTKTTAIDIALAGAALGPLLSIGGNLLKVYGGVYTALDKVALGIRKASAAETSSTMTPYGQMPYVGPDSKAINLGQSGINAAKGFAKGLATGLAPAVAAAGLGNIVVSATSGDMKDAGFEAGGALAGGILGAFGGPAGAMLGVGLGSFAGELLSGLFDTKSIDQELTESRQRFNDLFGDVSSKSKDLRTAKSDLARAVVRERNAEEELNRVRQNTGARSIETVQHELDLARAIHGVARARKEAKKAEQAHGVQLELARRLIPEEITDQARKVLQTRAEVQTLAEYSHAALRAGASSKDLRVFQENLTAAQERNHKANVTLLRSEQKTADLNPQLGRSMQELGDRITGRLVRPTLAGADALSHKFGSLGTAGDSLDSRLSGSFDDLHTNVSGALEAIFGDLSIALKAFGVKNIPSFALKHPGFTYDTKQSKNEAGRAQGGAVRVPGQGTADSVPLAVNGAMSAIVAPGEDLVVFTRHQRPLIDRAVANEYGVSGLPGFFGTFSRPHYMAKGGELSEPRIIGPAGAMRSVGQGAVHRDVAAAQAWLRKHRPKGGAGGPSGPAPPGFEALYKMWQPDHPQWDVWQAGLLLQKMGFDVAENPHFGGVSPVHTDGSYHYLGRAFDFNWPSGGAAELAHLRSVAPGLARLNPKDPLIEDAGGTNQHGHFAFAKGGTVTGKVSTFGPPNEGAGTTASGVSSSKPGIAIYDRSTLGDWFEVTIGGHTALLRQTDIGPAPSTGRKIDVTGAGAEKLGISPLGFPTDSSGTAVDLGSSLEKAKEQLAGTGKPTGGSGAGKTLTPHFGLQGHVGKGHAPKPTARTAVSIPPLGHSPLLPAAKELPAGVKSELRAPGLTYEGKVAIGERAVQQAEGTEEFQDDLKALRYQEQLYKRREKQLQARLKKVRGELKKRQSGKQRRRSLAQARGLEESLRDVRSSVSGTHDQIEEAKPTERDYADLQLARAESTSGKQDDIEALKHLEDLAKKELERAERSGDPREVAEATRNLTQAAEALKEATPTEEDFASRDLALAELTETLADDKSALEHLRDLAQQQLDAALQTPDPRDDIEAANRVKSITDSLKSLDETIQQQNELLQQKEQFEKERLDMDKRLAGLAEAQGPAFLANFAAWLDGAIGGPVSRGMTLPTTPGVNAGYK